MRRWWVVFPCCLRSVSTSGAKPERRQSKARVEATVYYIIPKKAKIRVPLLRKKSGTKTVPYDNNNNKKYEATVHSHFTPHFTNYKVNTMTDSYIRSEVKCQMSNAMNFGFLRGINMVLSI